MLSEASALPVEPDVPVGPGGVPCASRVGCWRRSAALVVATALAVALRAAEADEPLLLAPWLVSAAPLPAPSAAPSASAIVPMEAWTARSIVTLTDAFRGLPGVMMQDAFGGFEPPRLSIRGSGLQSAPSSRGVALLVDGLPLGLADGSFNSALFDPVLGSISVQRGLDGWRAAPAFTGGALDLRTDPPVASSVSAQIDAGSFGGVRARARFATPVASLALARARQGGYRDHSEQARTTLLGTFRSRAGPAAEWSANLYHAHARYEVPGPLTLASAFVSPRSVSSDVRHDQPQRVAEVTRAATTWLQHSPDGECEFSGSFAHTTDNFRQLAANGIARSRSDDASLQAVVTRRFVIGGFVHRIQAAASVTRGWREVARFVNAAGATGARFGLDSLNPTTSALRFEDAVALSPHLIATAGVTRIGARRDITDRQPGPTPTTLRLASSATLPQASLRWQFAPAAAVFAGVARAAEPPTFDDLVAVAGSSPNLVRRSQPLATQRALTWEIGTRGRAGRLAWDATAYRAAWRDEILRLADAQGLARGAVNAGPTTHEGLESSLRLLLAERPARLSLAASAAWIRAAFDHDPVYGCNRLAGLPPHIGSAEFLAEFSRGSFVAVGADWTAGATMVDHANRLAYGGRTLLHLRAGRTLPHGWRLYAEVHNLLDRVTIASTAGVLDLARNPAATAVFLPASGRSLTIGLAWSH